MGYKIIRCLECGGSVFCKNIYTSEPDGFYCKECNQEYFESVNYTGETTGIAFSKVCKEIQSLEQENEALKKKLSEAVEVIKFYADRFSYSWTKHDEVEYYSATIKNDDSMVKFTEKDGTEFENLCAGKKARAFLKENKDEYNQH